MRTETRKPTTVGELLTHEFLEPLELSQSELARSMGVQPRLVNELCRNRRAITAETALMLERALGQSADFWMNAQKATELWEALHNERSLARIERVQAVVAA